MVKEEPGGNTTKNTNVNRCIRFRIRIRPFLGSGGQGGAGGEYELEYEYEYEYADSHSYSSIPGLGWPRVKNMNRRIRIRPLLGSGGPGEARGKYE